MTPSFSSTKKTKTKNTQRKQYLTHSPAGRRRRVAHADLRAAAVQAARDAGAAGPPERRQRQRGIRRRRRHDGLGLRQAEELVRR